MGDGKWRGENRGIWNSGVVWFGGRGEGGGSDFGGAWIISPWAHHFGGVLFSPRIGEKNGGRELTSFLYVDFSFSFFFFLFFQRNFSSLHFSFPPTKQNLNSYQSKLTLGEAAWLHSYYVTLEEQISIHRQLLGFFFRLLVY